MQKKVVVIGSNGLLGQTLVNKLNDNPTYSLYTMAKGDNRNPKAKEADYLKIDLNDFDAIANHLNKLQPHFVINALAMTNVDACETEQEACDLINVDFVAHLATTCKQLGTHLIHISTDFIFDGLAEMYKESDKSNPVNYYGLSKLNSEKVLQEIMDNYSILRTILVFGKVANMKRSNIVLWVKKSLENNETIQIVADQYRMPTYVGSLADACILTMDKQAKGIFHISGNELCSIYDIALQIADFFKLPKSLLIPISSNTLNQKAKRPPKTGFVLDKAINILGFKPLTFKEGLSSLKDDL